MQDEQESLYSSLSYLPYVTWGEVWNEARAYFWIWCIWSFLLSIGLIAFRVFTPGDIIGDSGSSFMPQWFSWPRFFIVVSATLWFMRGKDIKVMKGEEVTFQLEFPELTCKSWLVYTLFLVGPMTFTLEHFPPWAAVPFCLAVLVGLMALYSLTLKGKENYLKLTDNKKGSS